MGLAVWPDGILRSAVPVQCCRLLKTRTLTCKRCSTSGGRHPKFDVTISCIWFQ